VITAQLPALQVVIPMLAAPLAMLVRSPLVSWLIAVLASVATVVIAVLLYAQVGAEGVISYAMGGWPAPWGIEYRVDAANAYVLLIVAAVGLVTLLAAPVSARDELDGKRLPLFYTAWLICITGLLGITITGDAFNVFVFFEVASLASYALISMGRDRRSLTAAYQYLIMGTIGTTFILIGIGFLYMMTGTLNMADLAVRVPEVADTRTVRAAFAFLMVGISLKLALFPLHLWLPNAYAYAPSVVTALLAATATKVAVYMLLRIFYTVFGFEFSFAELSMAWVLLPLALVGIFSPSLVAIFQENVKRMLAYSSVAQIGYMILGVSFVSVTGLTATLLHLFNHALMKGALFLALACVVYRVGSPRLASMAGLGREMPWTMAAFVIGGLSLIGVPLTVGFISKWYLLLGAIERGWWPVAALIVVSSLMAAVYIWRVVEAAYFRERPAGAVPVGEAPAALLVPAWGLTIANIWFGVQTSVTVGGAQRAAEVLIGVVGP
jgi:multicomponent Na+:H+ antiporter subunit D